MRSLISAFVVCIRQVYTCRCPYKIASLLPVTEVSRYFQASLCDLVHLKNIYFDDTAHILHDSVSPDHFLLLNSMWFSCSNAACNTQHE